MLLERKFGLTTNVMATKMIPSLAPQTVNPALNVDQFTNLMEVNILITYLVYFINGFPVFSHCYIVKISSN